MSPDGDDGLNPLHHVDLVNGKFAKTSAADLEQLFTAFAADPGRDRLVVHFHGGLVNRAAGLETAARLLPIYQGATSYPVFFIWNAGLLDVISHNLGDIAEEKIFKRLRDRLLQMAIGKAREAIGVRATTLDLPELRPLQARVRAEEQAAEQDDPLAEHDAKLRRPDATLTPEQEAFVQDELESDPIIAGETAAIAAGQAAGDDGTRGAAGAEVRDTLMSEEVLDELADDAGAPGDRSLITSAAVARRGVKVLAAVLKRFASGRDHGVYTTVVEELLRGLYLANAGQVVWQQMKQDTGDAFGDDPQRHGGTAFVQHLAGMDRGDTARTILVGHSTGAVYICELLKHADAVLPPGVKFDVVLLAPACTFTLFAHTLRDHGHRIGNLRIFTMEDALECADQLRTPVYLRSLLYFVSGVVEDEPDQPLLGMQRYHKTDGPYREDDFPEVEAVRRHIASRDDHVVWSIADGDSGLRTAARKHGDFDNDDDTLASVAHLVRNGFG